MASDIYRVIFIQLFWATIRVANIIYSSIKIYNTFKSKETLSWGK